MHCRECGAQLKETAAFCPGCGHVTRRGTASGGSKGSVYGGTSVGGPRSGMLAVGQVIDGKFRIEGQLGSGGMGTVYRTTRLHIGDEVALKVLWRQESGSADGVERLRREAGAAAKLKHPNAAAVHDLGVSADGLVYLAMEMVEGETLRDVLARGGVVAPTRVVEIAEQVCAALEEAHRQHVVHRDIKPENVMVREVGGEVRVKVLDFGIAKMTDAGPGGANLTQTGTISGTPFYMSPEQCLGEEIDGRSDIYSLGIVLYELLSGSVPFRSGTATAVVLQHVNQATGGIRQINIGVPETVERAVLRSLAKRREDRPQTATAFAQELRAALGGASGTPTITMSKAMAIGGYAGSAPATMGTLGTMGTRGGQSMQELFETGNQPAPARPPWMMPAIVVGAMAVLVIVGVTVGFLFTGDTGDTRNTSTAANNAARSTSDNGNTRAATVTSSDVRLSAVASSTRAPMHSNVYTADKAVDGHLETAWVEGDDDVGLGESIEVRLSEQARLISIGVWPGYFKSHGLWKLNNRVARAKIVLSDGRTLDAPFADIEAEQKVAVGGGPVTGFTITIESVYFGTDTRDTCISEITVEVAATTDAPLTSRKLEAMGIGEVWSDPAVPPHHTSWDFRPWEMPFMLPDTLRWNENYESERFYAVLLMSVPVPRRTGSSGPSECEGFVDESTRIEVQSQFPGRRVFTSRFGCTGPGVHYTNTNDGYNFLAVYAGSSADDAARTLSSVRAIGRWPDANIRTMTAVLDYGD